VWPRLKNYWMLAAISLIAFAASAVLALSSLAISEASAASYDGQNPVQAGCTSGAQNVGGENSESINEFSASTQILTSPSCPYAVWVAVHISSGANGQYRVIIRLSGGSSGDSVVLEEVASSPLIQSDMLSDENTCIDVQESITSLDGDTDSSVEDQLCNQGFGLSEPFQSSVPGQVTTTTSAPPSQTMSPPSTRGSGPPPLPAHPSIKHKACWDKHHHRVRCRKRPRRKTN
jgi:hypothetical protein